MDDNVLDRFKTVGRQIQATRRALIIAETRINEPMRRIRVERPLP